MDRERGTLPQCKWSDRTIPIRFVCVHVPSLYSKLSSFGRKSQFLQEDHARFCSLDVHESVARLQGKQYSL